MTTWISFANSASCYGNNNNNENKSDQKGKLNKNLI